jgi:hypothetical protein
MFPDVLGVLDRAGSARDSRSRPVRYCLPQRRGRRHPGVVVFRGSIPSPSVPLPTLRLTPCGFLRMTRGRCGSLLLHRMTLSFTTSRRFLSAHRRKPESSYFKMFYRGREGRLVSVPPPSEPDWRISRIRLSGWWSYPREGWSKARWASARLNSPCARKKALGQR